ncbi:hypothetical protein TNCV_4165221 [Trichonephila clavipes]|nr:hypothetical protein TNCV_4165221 [Trichonephila clavipes]
MRPNVHSVRKDMLPVPRKCDYDEEETNDEECNSKYDSSTEIDPDFEDGDTVGNKCLMCIDTETFGKNVTSKETTVTHSLSDEFLKRKKEPIVGTIREKKESNSKIRYRRCLNEGGRYPRIGPGCDEVIDETLEYTGVLNEVCLEQQQEALILQQLLSECIPNLLYRINITAAWLLPTLCCFGFKKAFHKTGCMSRPIAFPNDMLASMSAYSDSCPYPPTTSSTMGSFLNESRVISNGSFSAYQNYVWCHILN